MFIIHEFIESMPAATYRFCLYSPSLIPIWESDDPVTIVLDEFYTDEDPGEDGLIFFDSTLFPISVEFYFFHNILDPTKTCGFWPCFDLSDSPRLAIETTINFHRSRTNQLRKRWASAFYFFRNSSFSIFLNTAATYFIAFRLVGLSFVCNLVDTQVLRLIMSNTHDVLLRPPIGIHVGLIPTGTGTDSTRFFFSSSNYQVLQQYAKYVHSLIRFNVYEYKGLLFEGEIQRKKITKQKQK